MNTMLSEALREFTGLFKQLITNLLGNDAEIWGNEFKKFLRKERCWVSDERSVRPKKISRRRLPKSAPQPLLIPRGGTAVPLGAGPFTTRKRFVRNTAKNAPVKISSLGDNFTNWFLDKTEEAFPGSILRYADLGQLSVDGPIITELGGEEKAETNLIEVFTLMQMQPDGEDGPLLTNGCANIFYVRDIAGVLRAVNVHWDGDGWDVSASAVTNPHGWLAGSRVFSRNSR